MAFCYRNYTNDRKGTIQYLHRLKDRTLRILDSCIY